ncbi:unnamed protein product [Effrenium voratum]|nr:unnamed protein product [Effrenium voratum]
MPDASSLEGASWTFEFRSYTNEEELGAMMSAQLGLQWLLFRAVGRTSLKVEQGGQAELEDTFMLFGFLPAKIRWCGRLIKKDPEFRWETSEAVVAGLWVIDRPAPAERLRKDPWKIQAVLEPLVDGKKRRLAVLERVGHGRLAFLEDTPTHNTPKNA